MARVYPDPSNRQVYMTIRTDMLKERFLAMYEISGLKTRCCDLLGLNRRTLYHWLDNDPEFAHNFEEAEKVALGLLEDEAWRRAHDGVDKPVFWQGQMIGTVKEYSDNILLKLLAAKAPHKYGKNINELTGPNGQPLLPESKIIHVHSDIPLSSSEEEIEAQLPAPGINTGLPSREDYVEFEELRKKQDDQNLETL